MAGIDLAIVGAGTMGAGIAQVAVARGLNTLLYDAFPQALERGLNRISAGLERSVQRGRLTEHDRDAALARLTSSAIVADLAAAPFVIEAVPEDLDLKRAIFRQLSQLTPLDTILATNTSSISVTKIAAAADSPERVAGMHFFNPAPVLPLVEVIAGHLTTTTTMERTMEMARRLGKTPIGVKDTPGFVVNRVARHFYGESLRILGEGVPVETVDRVLRDGGGFKMGPFELMDMIGIDVNFAVTRSIFDAFYGDPRYRPHPIQERMVDANTLGRKTGRGFYSYDDGQG